MYLSGYEKETIIVFNEAEGLAVVETPNVRIKKALKQLIDEHSDKIIVEHDEDENGFISVKVPKKWIKIRGPRVLTDEQRAEYSERAKKMLASRRISIDISDEEDDEEEALNG